VDRQQLSLFEKPRPSEVETQLKNLDIDKLTPIDALIKLDELKKIINKKIK